MLESLKETRRLRRITERIMPIAKDFLYPRFEEEKRCHKLKRLVQHPNSYFMDIKCANCSTIKEAIFSHSQSTIICGGCSKVLCISTGGKAKIVMEGSKFRRVKHGWWHLLEKELYASFPSLVNRNCSVIDNTVFSIRDSHFLFTVGQC